MRFPFTRGFLLGLAMSVLFLVLLVVFLSQAALAVGDDQLIFSGGGGDQELFFDTGTGTSWGLQGTESLASVSSGSGLVGTGRSIDFALSPRESVTTTVTSGRIATQSLELTNLAGSTQELTLEISSETPSWVVDRLFVQGSTGNALSQGYKVVLQSPEYSPNNMAVVPLSLRTDGLGVDRRESLSVFFRVRGDLSGGTVPFEWRVVVVPVEEESVFRFLNLPVLSVTGGAVADPVCFFDVVVEEEVCREITVVERVRGATWGSVLAVFLLLVVIVGLFLLFKRGRGGGGVKGVDDVVSVRVENVDDFSFGGDRDARFEQSGVSGLRDGRYKFK